MRSTVVLDSDDNIRTVSNPAVFSNVGYKTLTNAQIIALPTTAVEVIPAQGANTMIVPLFAWLYLNWVADYGNIGNTGRIGIQYGITANSNLVALREATAGQVSNLLVDGASHPVMLSPSVLAPASGVAIECVGIGQFIDDPGTINAALSIYAVNSGSATGNYTDGDTGNTLAVAIPYIVFNISTGRFV